MASYLQLMFIVLFCGLTYFSHAYQFSVGGRNGWVSNPSENYNHWAGRMRFQVNDTLLFKYNRGISESALLVNKDDYEKCNTTNPIQKLNSTENSSIFIFNKSGPFYFITSNQTNCNKGQKLIVVVMAVRHHQRNTPPSPTFVSPSPSPAVTPLSPSPSPVNEGPSADSPTGHPVASPAGVSSPVHHSFATPACDYSVVFVSVISLVVSVGFGGFIVSH